MTREMETQFAINRKRAKWEDFVYSCRECKSEAGTVSGLTHSETCYVGSPDDHTPIGYYSDDPPRTYRVEFADSTLELLRTIVRRSIIVMEQGGETVGTDTIEKKLGEIDGVRWTATGSTHRVILGLGRTSPKGEFHLDDQRGVVVKVNPQIRFNENYTPVSTNIDELLTWEKAVETGTEQHFGEILAAAPDGMWLAMEYCMPISLRIRSEMKTRDMLFDKSGQQYIYPLVQLLEDDGWHAPDYKHGNIGLSDSGRPVLIDYGTGPDYRDPEQQQTQDES